MADFAMALAVVILVFLVGWQLASESMGPIRKFGFHFLTTSTWDPVVGAIWRVAVHLRDDRLVFHRARHRGAAEYRDRGLSH